MADWVDWHGRYEDPTSTQARRLPVVRRRIGEALDILGSSARRALSLCAGDGRDVLPELAARPHLQVECLLVEGDATLAAQAGAQAATLGVPGVTVLCADAARPETFERTLPVDLLLLCGIFGNVPLQDIRTTVAATPAMLARGGIVVWTRGLCDGVDLRPDVRRWFTEAGLDELSFEGEPELYGVGVARAGASPTPARALPERLFTFFR